MATTLSPTEIEKLKKKSFYCAELTPNTKLQVVNSSLNTLAQITKKNLSAKKDVIISVIEVPKERKS
jgi:hypothetical protein